MNFERTKVKVRNKKESRKVQEAMFKKGFDWEEGKSEVKFLDKPYLFFESNKKITYSEYPDTFEESLHKEVTVKDIIEVYKPKNPSHVVIWDEERGDPAKLFCSEKDAKDFIKELSERTGVIRDSILLCEIKSCKKVSITKSLRYNSHKI